MADVKDILGVPRAAQPGDRQDVQKEKKEKMKRPEGLSREAFALLGDIHPIMASHLVGGLKMQKKENKPKAATKGVVTFQYKAFKNPARSDDLQLTHWVKGYKDASGRVRDAEEGEYVYAKFNKKVNMTKYDDEEWESLLKADSGDWSREETDYLFELCERFDLRFTVIADRWDFTTAAAAGAAGAAVSTQRSVEDLKERYYSISRKLLMAREGNEALIANQTLVKYPFNANHERQRKTALEGLMARTNKQLQEENKLLAEAHRIEEVRAREAVAAGGITPGSAGAAARKAAAAVAASPRAGGKALSPGLLTADVKLAAAFPNVVAPEEPSLLGPDVQPVRPRPGVYARGLHAKDMAATMYNSLPGGQRAAKALEASLAELNFPMALEGPSHRSRAVCGSWLALRAEALALIELRRQAQARAYGDGRKAEKRKR